MTDIPIPINPPFPDNHVQPVGIPAMANIRDWQSQFLSDAIKALDVHDERRAAELITEAMRSEATWRDVCGAMVCTGGCVELDDRLLVPHLRVEVTAAGMSEIHMSLDVDADDDPEAALEVHRDLIVPRGRTVVLVQWRRPELVLVERPGSSPQVEVRPGEVHGPIIIQTRGSL